MLSVISIGINKYPCCDLQNISCAGKDAHRIYEVFKNIMEDEFAEHSSICLSDITSAEFIHLLDSLKFSITNDEDTLVLYFSGHASNIKNYGSVAKFSLLFSDYNEDILSGYVSLENEIIDLLNKISCNIVLILDCCYSGEGLRFATSVVGDHQISVLSATSNRMLAEFSVDGSELANAIVLGIRDIKVHNYDFTLNRLQQCIQSRYPKSQINTAAGYTGEIYLKKAIDFKSDYYDLKKRFLWQIQNGVDKYKEALWYSISDIPEPIEMEIFFEYFHSTNEDSISPVESNWLVRRAIGSAIACLDDVYQRLSLTQKLIDSRIWQEQCIGIIGARYDIKKNAKVFEYLTKLVSERIIKKIDAIWLANLYAADNLNYDYHLFLDTSLMSNSWGIQEVYKTAHKHGCTCEIFVKELESRGISYQEWFQCYHQVNESMNSNLYQILSQKNERGRLPVNSKAKFILSSLYGNWRGHKLINCRMYFKNNLDSVIRAELEAAQKFPQIEYRMALFEYFMTEPELLMQHARELEWGLVDVHPWVRRTAIQAYKSAKINLKECNKSIIDYILLGRSNIGELDLYIEYNPHVDTQDILIQALTDTKRYNQFEIEGVRVKVERELS